MPAAGIEPARPKSGEFKSPVSTFPPRGPLLDVASAAESSGSALPSFCAAVQF